MNQEYQPDEKVIDQHSSRKLATIEDQWLESFDYQVRINQKPFFIRNFTYESLDSAVRDTFELAGPQYFDQILNQISKYQSKDEDDADQLYVIERCIFILICFAHVKPDNNEDIFLKPLTEHKVIHQLQEIAKYDPNNKDPQKLDLFIALRNKNSGIYSSIDQKESFPALYSTKEYQLNIYQNTLFLFDKIKSQHNSKKEKLPKLNSILKNIFDSGFGTRIFDDIIWDIKSEEGEDIQELYFNQIKNFKYDMGKFFGGYYENDDFVRYDDFLIDIKNLNLLMKRYFVTYLKDFSISNALKMWQKSKKRRSIDKIETEVKSIKIFLENQQSNKLQFRENIDAFRKMLSTEIEMKIVYNLEGNNYHPNTAILEHMGLENTIFRCQSDKIDLQERIIEFNNAKVLHDFNSTHHQEQMFDDEQRINNPFQDYDHRPKSQQTPPFSENPTLRQSRESDFEEELQDSVHGIDNTQYHRHKNNETSIYSKRPLESTNTQPNIHRFGQEDIGARLAHASQQAPHLDNTNSVVLDQKIMNQGMAINYGEIADGARIDTQSRSIPYRPGFGAHTEKPVGNPGSILDLNEMFNFFDKNTSKATKWEMFLKKCISSDITKIIKESPRTSCYGRLKGTYPIFEMEMYGEAANLVLPQHLSIQWIFEQMKLSGASFVNILAIPKETFVEQTKADGTVKMEMFEEIDYQVKMFSPTRMPRKDLTAPNDKTQEQKPNKYAIVLVNGVQDIFGGITIPDFNQKGLVIEEFEQPSKKNTTDYQLMERILYSTGCFEKFAVMSRNVDHTKLRVLSTCNLGEVNFDEGKSIMIRVPKLIVMQRHIRQVCINLDLIKVFEPYADELVALLDNVADNLNMQTQYNAVLWTGMYKKDVEGDGYYKELHFNNMQVDSKGNVTGGGQDKISTYKLSGNFYNDGKIEILQCHYDLESNKYNICNFYDYISYEGCINSSGEIIGTYSFKKATGKFNIKCTKLGWIDHLLSRVNIDDPEKKLMSTLYSQKFKRSSLKTTGSKFTKKENKMASVKEMRLFSLRKDMNDLEAIKYKESFQPVKEEKPFMGGSTQLRDYNSILDGKVFGKELNQCCEAFNKIYTCLVKTIIQIKIDCRRSREELVDWAKALDVNKDVTCDRTALFRSLVNLPLNCFKTLQIIDENLIALNTLIQTIQEKLTEVVEKKKGMDLGIDSIIAYSSAASGIIGSIATFLPMAKVVQQGAEFLTEKLKEERAQAAKENETVQNNLAGHKKQFNSVKSLFNIASTIKNLKMELVRCDNLKCYSNLNTKKLKEFEYWKKFIPNSNIFYEFVKGEIIAVLADINESYWVNENGKSFVDLRKYEDQYLHCLKNISYYFQNDCKSALKLMLHRMIWEPKKEETDVVEIHYIGNE